ncbi:MULTISPECIES: 16S rRNA (cytidine(1402)-2'-O)-methyltransferase [unclassified Pseudodesulfovibrio]|uniref:16S rRNA (cytidine(1402)-2'-O)-methyltransferase n=1 Tax=unclassified Pseudodesulfovibrio TaxID=2661612 RepID=UPI000FEB6A5A|nr:MULTISPECIES: 16S rRNA (cytidine(1402)-2'-O)-methyltransferase [unclassified Pseudodesulfovibrio]MCJ2166138.1 16S rRNA (cytidine(1402)-2'-O)-methyltransferase [Pseudodesulfovibrio sp. S3-i]RWU02371.1 16S rRNA (cytidine(1402)-2'-O)-methyltransferase [Pseudodesulfovibrio sp. S3]
MSNTGTLWVVATPLGNAGDLSPRARDILTEADVILAEDTRRAGLLFKRLGLERHGRLMSFFEHNEDKRLPKVLDFLEDGLDVALISDAGTPLLSDPGFTLVRACRENGIRVSPVPGPSAPVTALSASGLPPLPYTFLGFPPRKKSQTEKLFAAHRDTGATLVFFERKSRLAGTLDIARDILGDREFCVARELTKEFEEFLRGNLATLEAFDLDLRGELTVIIGPAGETGKTIEADILHMLDEESDKGDKPKEIARRVAVRSNGWTAKDVYALMRSR